MYMLAGPPFRLGNCSRGRPVVVDRSGEKVGLLGDAWSILQELSTEEKWAGTQIAYVSRTDEPGERGGGGGGGGGQHTGCRNGRVQRAAAAAAAACWGVLRAARRMPLR